MRTIVLYTRRNVGMYCLSHLVALGYKVKVITDDSNVSWLAGVYGCELVTLDTMGDFDLFVCVHGNKRIGVQYLNKGTFINVHPCLSRYKGADPIRRYIENRNIMASVGCHYMTEMIDDGPLICEIQFETGVVKTYAEFYNLALPIYYECLTEALSRV